MCTFLELGQYQMCHIEGVVAIVNGDGRRSVFVDGLREGAQLFEYGVAVVNVGLLKVNLLGRLALSGLNDNGQWIGFAFYVIEANDFEFLFEEID